ncbi:MAG: phosphate-starvation-inducible PsiE family protein [Dorea sp.]
MQFYIEAFLKKISSLLEIVIAIMLSIGIILLCIRMACTLGNIPNLEVYPNYEDLLETCFNLIIGVELIRMVYHHTPNTVFEVLLFAIARQIIIDHSSIWGSLIGVCAIAVLFATRKYLFCEFDVKEEIVFRASTRVKTVNKILDLDIPYEDRENDTLLDVVNRKFEEYDIENGVGACVYFHDCGLRVAKIYQGKISRIEVIRAIH